jgi:hypothetical protein
MAESTACRGPDGDGTRARDAVALATTLDASKLWQLALLELWLSRHGI